MRATTAYALVWIAVAFSISVGIYVTGSLAPMWAFLFPSFVSISSKD